MKFKIFNKWWKKLILISLVSGFLTIISVYACYKLIESTTNRFVYSDIRDIPSNKVGLVLGTSKYYGVRINPFFRHRINAAAKLYKAGKIKYIIVSGDNSINTYNEPEDMRKALIKRGIPNSRIYLDYAGFRTFDSMVRCKEIFGQDSITVISQKFHNHRAVFIARHKGIKAIAFNAKNVAPKYAKRQKYREILARVKAFIDLYVIDKKPKYLGERIYIN